MKKIYLSPVIEVSLVDESLPLCLTNEKLQDNTGGGGSGTPETGNGDGGSTGEGGFVTSKGNHGWFNWDDDDI